MSDLLLDEEAIKEKIIGWGWILSPAKMTDMICQHQETAKAEVKKLMDGLEHRFGAFAPDGEIIELYIFGEVWQDLKKEVE